VQKIECQSLRCRQKVGGKNEGNKKFLELKSFHFVKKFQLFSLVSLFHFGLFLVSSQGALPPNLKGSFVTRRLSVAA
jgi:hypothetical protein